MLASTSPRRRALLGEAGFAHEVRAPEVDDGELTPGCVDPTAWVIALAYLKARAGQQAHGPTEHLLLGADTVVVKDGDIIGQPRDASDATAIIRRLSDGHHTVVTGVAMLRGEDRMLFADAATVHVGAIDEGEILSYVATGDWQGKAGAYNFSEREAAGWPIRCEGDPTTVMGLPIERLRALLGPDTESGS